MHKYYAKTWIRKRTLKAVFSQTSRNVGSWMLLKFGLKHNGLHHYRGTWIRYEVKKSTCKCHVFDILELASRHFILTPVLFRSVEQLNKIKINKNTHRFSTLLFDFVQKGQYYWLWNLTITPIKTALGKLKCVSNHHIVVITCVYTSFSYPIFELSISD